MLPKRQPYRSKRAAAQKSYPLTHYILGWILSEKGDFHAAAEEYRRLVEIRPSSVIGQRLQEQLSRWTADGLIPTLETSEKQDQ